jgi:hypothetical protein
MTRIASDTDPIIENLQIELIRSMPPWKKFAIWNDLNKTVRLFALSGIKDRFPEAPPEQLKRLLAERILGPEIVKKVYDQSR